MSKPCPNCGYVTRDPAWQIEYVDEGRQVRVGPYILRLTCWACPEQYDVYAGALQVGYLRLRHGEFRVDFPDCGDETIYRAWPSGEGRFRDDERDKYLLEAVAAIDAQVKAQPVQHTGKEG